MNFSCSDLPFFRDDRTNSELVEETIFPDILSVPEMLLLCLDVVAHAELTKNNPSTRPIHRVFFFILSSPCDGLLLRRKEKLSSEN